MSTEQKFWTFAEALDKIQADTDTDEEDPDETFVTLEEIIGYANEGIDEAEGEILKIDEDYFLTRDYLMCVAGQSEYDMPENILADKLRKVRYNDGQRRYPVKKLRRKELFEMIDDLEDSNNASADYMHYIRNDTPGQRKFVLLPPARETSVVAPMSPVSAFIRRWYIRNANRIPLPGEYVNPENLLPAAFDLATGAITVDPTFPYVTGDKLKFSLKSTAFTLPGGLEEGTVYYAVRVSDTRIKLATSAANARAAVRGLVAGDRIQEVPSGTVNGTTGSDGNDTFLLSEVPYSAASVVVHVNGVFMRQGTHYNIEVETGTLTFLAPYIPQIGQEIDVTFYPESDEPTTNPTEVQEALANGDGVTTVFNLTQTPASNAAVTLHVGGVQQTQGIQYEISGRVITFYDAPADGAEIDAVYDTAIFFFSTTGTGFFTMKVAATRAIIDATVIDIPEFASFVIEWAKARIQFKDADPRLQTSVNIVEAKGKKMVEVLTDREPDDDNTVEGDFTHYEEMN